MTTLRSTRAMPPALTYSRPREDKRAAQLELQARLDAFHRAGGRIERLDPNTPRRSD